MVIKVKEISIGRGRKYTWDYQSVDYHIGITVEGTTAKDTVEDMLKKAIEELTPIEASEQDRCRFVYEGSTLLEEVEYKDKVEKSVEQTNVSPEGNSGNTDSKPLPVVAEVISTPTTTTEEVFMDPNDVTIIMKTPKSLLVTKKGYQKWIAFSLMADITEGSYEIGEYIEVLTIKEDKAKWFNELKSWDKLEVRKS